ncbi:hypothetical protein [Plantactinospora sp. CA-290183]|uniref:hypothetical protein n=1 Tax=Plantactinospora sp. CA-290183 TaxID=3240006 RepID=UPI003D941852
MGERWTFLIIRDASVDRGRIATPPYAATCSNFYYRYAPSTQAVRNGDDRS